MTKRYDTEQDILPTLVRLTGLSEKQVDAALEELDRKGFIQLDKTQGNRIGITLCDPSL